LLSLEGLPGQGGATRLRRIAAGDKLGKLLAPPVVQQLVRDLRHVRRAQLAADRRQNLHRKA
jgi:hypothetical protein